MGKMDEGRLYRARPGSCSARRTRGDEVAVAIVERLADEAVAMVVSALRRLHLTTQRRRRRARRRRRTGRAARCSWAHRAGIVPRSPRTPGSRCCDAPPVVGAALLGLDRLAGAGADAQLRGVLVASQFERNGAYPEEGAAWRGSCSTR